MAASVATLAGVAASIPDEALEALRAQIRGEVLEPSDPGYAEVRATFNAMHDGNPALIVSCSGTADVVDAGNFAREQGLAVTARGGGHSIAGLSAIDGGLLIDLAPMRGVHVDPDERLARVQGGALWVEVDRETQAFTTT
jgi:FAD/FMN-containing dehydrogenase